MPQFPAKSNGTKEQTYGLNIVLTNRTVVRVSSLMQYMVAWEGSMALANSEEQ